MIPKQIKGEDIFFTDETGIDLNPFSYDYIRLYPEELKKLREGDPELCELVNRQVKKFEKGIMVAGGISYYGLSNIIFIEGTMNNFAYGQTLIFYNEDIEEINRKNGVRKNQKKILGFFGFFGIFGFFLVYEINKGKKYRNIITVLFGPIPATSYSRI